MATKPMVPQQVSGDPYDFFSGLAKSLINQQVYSQQQKQMQDAEASKQLFELQKSALSSGQQPYIGQSPATLQQIVGSPGQVSFQPKSQTVPIYYKTTTGEIVDNTGNVVNEIPKESQIVSIPQTLQEQVDEKTALTRATDMSKLNFKRDTLRADVLNFLTIDEQIPRGSGLLGRIITGGKSKIAQIRQKKGSKIGTATALHDATSKRLRVQLVRAAGDVGNINIVEQEAAEKIVPQLFEGEDVVAAKRAFLLDIVDAIDSGDATRIQNIFSDSGIGYTLKSREQIQRENATVLKKFNINKATE